jgi:periplasmic divalent cation tolerance protein
MIFQLVLTTCPTEQVAKVIAEHLINEKLAACVNILPNITSIYSWQNEVQYDNEIQLLIKTTSNKFTQMNARINELHPYDVVEVIALNIQQGDNHYLYWIREYLN